MSADAFKLIPIRSDGSAGARGAIETTGIDGVAMLTTLAQARRASHAYPSEAFRYP